MIRTLPTTLAALATLVGLGVVAAPAVGQSAPPLTELQIVAVTSASQAERIAPDQRETARHHAGPVTVVVRGKGIGRARLIRLNGAVAMPPSTTRALCGPAVTAGACKPGETTTGVETTYHLGVLPRGTSVMVQDTSANLPAVTLTSEITID
ncbi:hypothetical protein FHT00_001505 [Sphingomonas insulae]|uniref:DUF4402 domain-containing protein n=1 Tax=Sphingomonas insulae TaxID=424800 RepID=A0ABP3T1P4_9SPHN|nr:DUF4879 domain-containing protein [Sphingomonas insulae]NIJ29558.1 hypothetical protein [Sphingomonas insulae]